MSGLYVRSLSRMDERLFVPMQLNRPNDRNAIFPGFVLLLSIPASLSHLKSLIRV